MPKLGESTNPMDLIRNTDFRNERGFVTAIIAGKLGKTAIFFGIPAIVAGIGYAKGSNVGQEWGEAAAATRPQYVLDQEESGIVLREIAAADVEFECNEITLLDLGGNLKEGDRAASDNTRVEFYPTFWEKEVPDSELSWVFDENARITAVSCFDGELDNGQPTIVAEQGDDFDEKTGIGSITYTVYVDGYTSNATYPPGHGGGVPNEGPLFKEMAGHAGQWAARGEKLCDVKATIKGLFGADEDEKTCAEKAAFIDEKVRTLRAKAIIDARDIVLVRAQAEAAEANWEDYKRLMINKFKEEAVKQFNDESVADRVHVKFVDRQGKEVNGPEKFTKDIYDGFRKSGQIKELEELAKFEIKNFQIEVPKPRELKYPENPTTELSEQSVVPNSGEQS